MRVIKSGLCQLTVKFAYNEEGLDQAIEDTMNQHNLVFEKVVSITIHYDKYDPTRAGSYIDLPLFIKLKKACVNIKNADNRWFKY